MKKKYYNRAADSFFDLENDGCTLDEWVRGSAGCSFARHADGFLVFVSPENLSASDEYADSDPYSVEENRENDFHQRRIDTTVALAKEAIKNISGSVRLLDIGCGQGHVTKAIADALDDVEVSGFDYSVSAIEYAHQHYPDIDFCVADAYAPPYPPDYFDVVVCNNLWEHVPDPLRLLSKISACLRNGGALIVSTPSRYRVSNLLRSILGRPLVFMSEHHVTEYSVGQVVEQLRFGGFAVEQTVSKPISEASLKARIAKAILQTWVTLVGSHHHLEATVFFLARKQAT